MHRIIFFVALMILFWPSEIQAKETRTPAPLPQHFARPAMVSVYDRHFIPAAGFAAFETGFLRGAYLAGGELEGHRVIVVGAGPGRAPEIRIFSTAGGLLASFVAFDNNSQNGVRVAIAQNKIFAALNSGQSPVKAFDLQGRLLATVDPFDKNFSGGIRLAALDDRVYVAPGPGLLPKIKVFSTDLKLENEFSAFDNSMQDGVNLAVIRSDSENLIAAVPESWSGGEVRLLKSDGQLVAVFPVFDAGMRNGLTVSACLPENGIDRVCVARNGGTWPEVRVYNQSGNLLTRFLGADPAYRGGLSMAGTGAGLAIAPISPAVWGATNREKYIFVSIGEQRLYAFEHGRLSNSFLVSTGVKRFPTPVMETAVAQKIPVMDYRGYYGPRSPFNYFLRNVKYNLRIRGPILIHYAYWHNNFGNPMSHGCVNLSFADAQWIYSWAEVGTTVSVKA